MIEHLDENFFLVRFDRLTPAEKRYQSVAPRRSGLIAKGMIYSPAYGDTAFTVPLFDEFLRRQQAG